MTIRRPGSQSVTTETTRSGNRLDPHGRLVDPPCEVWIVDVSDDPLEGQVDPPELCRRPVCGGGDLRLEACHRDVG
jgi:hypothetical protein